jgi:hypothetical protein
MFSCSKAPGRATRWLLLSLTLVLGVCACGSAPVDAARPKQTQPPSTLTAKLVSYSSPSVRAETNQPATATATCNAGEQVIAGSFSADIFEADSIIASYPSSDHAWTVIADSPVSFIILSVQAYCVPADFPLGIKIVQGSGTVTCPTGSVLVNGGFQGGASTSQPDGNGWTSDSATTYALCATQHLAAGAVVSAPEKLPPGFGVGGGGSVTCAQDQVATGGGFSGGAYSPTYFGPGANFSGWAINGSANNSSSPDPAPLVWAVCNSVM